MKINSEDMWGAQREAKGHIEGVQKSARLEQVSGFEVLKFDGLTV